MMKRTILLRAGTRSSRLARLQAAAALDFLAARTPYRFAAVFFKTPGDRDLATPIERSAPDFFTRDLDDAVRSGAIDCAVHSAKDLPSPLPEDLDFFWLPEREDPRDCWVLRTGASLKTLGRRPVIGVSSTRRADYARRIFPRARLVPIRGSVDSRLDQLDAGAFDAVLMAVAGLRRLGRADRVTEPIPLDALTPPEAQGALAVTFRAGNRRMQDLRAAFVKAVRFVSAGVGDDRLCTLAGADDIRAADVVLYDDLMGAALTRLARPGAKLVPVGKRCGAHSMEQPEITRLLCDEVRKGYRVVRLKGGDAGLFGRLAEETDALAALRIPFLVRPGVSALTAATTGTGMLLTRRGESRGFCALTPRSSGSEFPFVLFMAVKIAAEEAKKLIASGASRTKPVAIVFDAAGPRERVVRGTLGALAAGRMARALKSEDPGLVVVGSAAAYGWPAFGPLAGRRVLLTCSGDVMPRAALAVEDRGGRPVRWPMIELRPRELKLTPGNSKASRPLRDEWIVLTSPAAVRCFATVFTGDRRDLPKFMTCGGGTAAALRRLLGVESDVTPSADFSAKGLMAEIRKLNLRGQRVLRLRSAKAGGGIAAALRRRGARVDDVVLYDNVPVVHEGPLPDFDEVFFASASGAEAFLAAYGMQALRGKRIAVMGEPTRAALPRAFRTAARTVPVDFIPRG